MEILEYLHYFFNIVAWALKNLDLFLGGTALLALFLNPGMGAEKGMLILMAVIGLGIRAVRIYRKYRSL